MNFGRIRGVNKPVSRILLGTAVSPMLLGQDADEMLDAAFESGINAFDTARNYGGAERSLREEQAGGFTSIDLLQVGLFSGDGVVF